MKEFVTKVRSLEDVDQRRRLEKQLIKLQLCFSSNLVDPDVIRYTHQKLPRGEWFHEIIVGARIETFYLCFLAGTGRQKYHGHVLNLRMTPHLSQQTETIELRHHDIGQQKIGMV